MSAKARIRRAAALVLVAAAFLASPARADEQGDLDKGKNAYLTRQYDEADTRFRAMLDPRSGTVHDPLLVAQAYMYWGAVMVAKKQPQQASLLFEQLLLKDPHYEPDPLSFPTEVLDAFTDTKNRIRQKLNQVAQDAARREAERRQREELERRRQAERLVLLERLAAEEKETVEHQRWIAFVPFGAGQFQNGQKTLGWLLLGAEALFIAAGSVAVPFYYAERNAADAARSDPTNCNPTAADAASGKVACYQSSNERRHDANANTLQAVNLAFYGAFAATAVIGIVQANARYEPRVVVVKKRVLPEPVIEPQMGREGRPVGGVVGLKLAF